MERPQAVVLRSIVHGMTGATRSVRKMGLICSLLATRYSLLPAHVAFSIALIVLERSSHWVVSVWSCFRPAGVSE